MSHLKDRQTDGGTDSGQYESIIRSNISSRWVYILVCVFVHSNLENGLTDFDDSFLLVRYGPGLT